MSDTPAPPPPAPAEAARKRQLLWVTLTFALLGAGFLAYWFFVLEWRERTDNAYVGGDLVPVNARLSGTVVALNGRNMDSVNAGDSLVTLDASDANLQLEKAASALAGSVRQYRQQSAQLAQLEAAIVTQQLDLQRARADLARREPLVKEQAIAAEELDHARDAVTLAQSALIQTQRQADSVHALLDGTTVRTHPSVLQAKAAYADAWLTARRNAVLAPIAGYITQHNVQLGQRIQPGQTLMTLVPLAGVWVDANFKESQLRHLRIGQDATVISDLYGSEVTYHGKVTGIGIGTGSAFALLPAQNASGNWIKVIQRVPVRIQLDAEEVRAHPLRIGLSTTVRVSTRDRSGPVLRPIGESGARATAVYDPDTQALDAAIERIIAAQLH